MADETARAIGLHIKQARENAGLSQAELARILNYKSSSSVTRAETGEIDLPQSTLAAFADALHVPITDLLGAPVQSSETPKTMQHKHMTRIPVLGTIAAGTPITAVEETSEYIDLDPDLAARGEFFGLRVRGDSMSPDIRAGDIVICRKQDFVDDGKIAALLIGDEATVKQVKHTSGGMMLIGYNAAVFPPRLYSKHEVESIPITVCGQVVQVRRDLW